MDKGSQSFAAPPTDTPNDILDLTIEANMIAPNDAHTNAHELRNDLLLQRRLARVRYEKGHYVAGEGEETPCRREPQGEAFANAFSQHLEGYR